MGMIWEISGGGEVDESEILRLGGARECVKIRT